MALALAKIAAVDFETEAIQPRPLYPPRPVGMAYCLGPLKKAEHDYLPCRTPLERQQCLRVLHRLVREGYQLVFHNASFDLDVAETHLGFRWPSVHHDTLLLAYLHDPRAPRFSLKPLAEKHLNEPPAERDTLNEWILANVKEATKKTAGAFICRAPFELVRPYALGDVDRTYRLFRLWEKALLKDKAIARAYDRERKVTRVLVKMERRGVGVATAQLRTDLALWKKQKQRLEAQLYKDLQVPKAEQAEFPWGGKNFAAQLLRSGAVAHLPMTKKGNPSTSAEALAPLIPEALGQRLELRAQLQTCISTFAEPWLQQAETGGRFYARFNQVRQDYHGGGSGVVGTTTGRLSMTPNLQNVIRSDKGDKVPQLRRYLVPRRGWYWLKRDYSQQEFRIFAHFEEGELLARYQANVTMDAHVVTGQILAEKAGVQLERRQMKDINFGVLYGMGQDKMARKLKLDAMTTKRTLAAYLQALPGIKDLRDALKERAADDQPIYTWGGRRYYCEPDQWDPEHNRWRKMDYKLLNLLVQGSAADATKEAMVRYDESGWNEDDRGPLLLQVHDELDSEAPAKLAKEAMKVLRETMMSLEFDVPLLSDGSASKVSWDDVEDVTW